MNRLAGIILALFIFVCGLPYVGIAGERVGHVHVDSWNTAPPDAYELHRNGRIVSGLYQDMPVQNDDLVVPLKRGCVILEYVSGCPSVKVNSSTRVSCAGEQVNSGCWQGFYNKINSLFGRYDLEETQGTTLRGQKPEDDKGMESDKPDAVKEFEDGKW